MDEPKETDEVLMRESCAHVTALGRRLKCFYRLPDSGVLARSNFLGAGSVRMADSQVNPSDDSEIKALIGRLFGLMGLSILLLTKKRPPLKCARLKRALPSNLLVVCRILASREAVKTDGHWVSFGYDFSVSMEVPSQNPCRQLQAPEDYTASTDEDGDFYRLNCAEMPARTAYRFWTNHQLQVGRDGLLLERLCLAGRSPSEQFCRRGRRSHPRGNGWASHNFEAIRASDHGCGAPDPLRRSIGPGRSESSPYLARVFLSSPAHQISVGALPRSDSEAKRFDYAAVRGSGVQERDFFGSHLPGTLVVELPVTHNLQADGFGGYGTVSTAPALVDNGTLCGCDKMARFDWDCERNVGLARQMTALGGERNTADRALLDIVSMSHPAAFADRNFQIPNLSMCYLPADREPDADFTAAAFHLHMEDTKASQNSVFCNLGSKRFPKGRTEI